MNNIIGDWRPFQNTLDKIDKFFKENTNINFNFVTEEHSNNNWDKSPRTPSNYKNYDEHVIILIFILNLGVYLKENFGEYPYKTPTDSFDNKIKKKINDNIKRLKDNDLIKKFIIINYYCFRFDENNIRLLMKSGNIPKNISDQFINDKYDIDSLVKFVRSFLKLIFHHYNPNDKEYDFKINTPDNIFKFLNHNHESGGRTRRKKRKSKKSRKSKQKRSRKARK
jgi:hypothetical protein